jgi:hypothetical protein
MILGRHKVSIFGLIQLMDGSTHLLSSVLCSSTSETTADILVEQPFLSKYCQAKRRLLLFCGISSAVV